MIEHLVTPAVLAAATISGEAIAALLVASVAAVSAVVAAVVSGVAASRAGQVNDAVNHRHADTQPRLYDLALRTDQRLDELVQIQHKTDQWQRQTDQRIDRLEQEGPNE